MPEQTKLAIKKATVLKKDTKKAVKGGMLSSLSSMFKLYDTSGQLVFSGPRAEVATFLRVRRRLLNVARTHHVVKLDSLFNEEAAVLTKHSVMRTQVCTTCRSATCTCQRSLAEHSLSNDEPVSPSSLSQHGGPGVRCQPSGVYCADGDATTSRERAARASPHPLTNMPSPSEVTNDQERHVSPCLTQPVAGGSSEKTVTPPSLGAKLAREANPSDVVHIRGKSYTISDILKQVRPVTRVPRSVPVSRVPRSVSTGLHVPRNSQHTATASDTRPMSVQNESLAKENATLRKVHAADADTIADLQKSLEARPSSSATSDAIQDVVASTVSAAMKPVVAAFADILRSKPDNTSSNKVRAKDVRLQKFSGNTVPNATTILPEKYLSFLLWLENALSLCHGFGLDSTNTVLAIVQALDGAASKAFCALFGSQNFTAWSIKDLKTNLMRLIPECTTQFLEQAVTMQFNRVALQDNLRAFQLLIKHSSMPKTPAYVHRQLQSKLLSAVPNLFTIALTQYNLTFRVEEGDTVDDLFYKASQIVLALQADNHPALKVKPATAAASAPVPTTTTAPTKPLKRTVRFADTSPAPAAKKMALPKVPPVTEEEKPYYTWAKKNGVACLRCGVRVADYKKKYNVDFPKLSNGKPDFHAHMQSERCVERLTKLVAGGKTVGTILKGYKDAATP